VLDENGYHNYFGDDKWKCIKGKLVVEKGEKQNTFYWTSTRLFATQVNALKIF